MPPRAIKHQLTCPFELTSGNFLIGRRGILVIPRNRLVTIDRRRLPKEPFPDTIVTCNVYQIWVCELKYHLLLTKIIISDYEKCLKSFSFTQLKRFVNAFSTDRQPWVLGWVLLAVSILTATDSLSPSRKHVIRCWRQFKPQIIRLALFSTQYLQKGPAYKRQKVSF